ncbi:MAG: efflux RND transporter periplasmic adaptor subunit [Bacteroidota bacterium]
MYQIKIKLIPFITVIVLASLASCSSDPKKSEKNETATEEPKGEANALELTSEQMETVGITIGNIEQKNLDAVVKANGQLAVPPQNKADVSILSGGIITRINVLEGQQVRKGQVLATINNQDLIKIQQDYLASRNSFVYVEAEYERQKQLQAADAGTGKSYQSAQATFNAEKSKLTAYESQLRQLGVSPASIAKGKIISQFPVLSPINGTVGQITANTGAFVQPGTSIMEVVDNSKIHCDLTVFEKDLMAVKVGQKVSFQLTNQENQLISGRINGINKSFENESKGVIVHAVIDNAKNKNLIPGMYVTALISTGSKLMPALPVDAIVRSEGKQYIFVVDENAKKNDAKTFSFIRTEVKTGVSEQGYVQVVPIEELPAKARVVTKGAFYLQSKASGGGEEE